MFPGKSSVVPALAAAVLLISGCASPEPSQAEPSPIPDITASAAPTAPAEPPASAVPERSAPALPAGTQIPVQQADAALQPAPAPPVALDIAGTDISVRVIDVGIEDNDAMEIPESFWEAGWYRYGPSPGADEGNAVIAAHVDSLTEVMPFAQLKDVEIGTVVTVGLADGESLAYEVTDVSNVPKATLDGSEIFRRDGPHQLKVITCGGDWLPEKGDYEDNIVLTASLL